MQDILHKCQCQRSHPAALTAPSSVRQRRRWFRSRVRVAAPLACFPAGHLRSVRVRSVPPQDGHWFGARLNPPVPYLLAGPADLLVELWFHLPSRWTADQYSACDAQPHGDTLSFPGLSLSGDSEPRPVTVRLELWEDQHTLR